MFITIMAMDKVDLGDVVVMKFDKEWNNITARQLSGSFVGVVTKEQPDGCVSYDTCFNKIGDARVLCHVAMILGSHVILFSETHIFSETTLKRSELGGKYAVWNIAKQY